MITASRSPSLDIVKFRKKRLKERNRQTDRREKNNEKINLLVPAEAGAHARKLKLFRHVNTKKEIDR